MIKYFVCCSTGQPVVSFLYKHSSTPTPSTQQYNPMRDSTTPAPPTEGCPRAPVSYSVILFLLGQEHFLTKDQRLQYSP